MNPDAQENQYLYVVNKVKLHLTTSKDQILNLNTADSFREYIIIVKFKMSTQRLPLITADPESNGKQRHSKITATVGLVVHAAGKKNKKGKQA